MLDGWAKVRGIQDAVLEFHCEPGCDEAVALCEEVSFAERHVYVNLDRLGHAMNVLQSMNCALSVFGKAQSEYAIQANDDCVPSADLLELHAWHRDHYVNDPTVLALSAGRGDRAADGGLAAVWRSQLIGSMSGFHRDKWELLSARWAEGIANWWWWVDEHWLQGGPGLDVLFPALSRVDDIGAPGNTPSFVSDPPPQQYYEVPGQRELGFDRRVAVRE